MENFVCQAFLRRFAKIKTYDVQKFERVGIQ